MMSNGTLAGIIIACILGGVIFGAIVSYFIVKSKFQKQLSENPPISEEQIRSMYAQMGRKPSEQQVRQIMNNFKSKNKK